jgi:hypothetical protein
MLVDCPQVYGRDTVANTALSPIFSNRAAQALPRFVIACPGWCPSWRLFYQIFCNPRLPVWSCRCIFRKAVCICCTKFMCWSTSPAGWVIRIGLLHLGVGRHGYALIGCPSGQHHSTWDRIALKTCLYNELELYWLTSKFWNLWMVRLSELTQ